MGHMKVLGIESTAHTFGVGLADEEKIHANVKSMFEPDEGGIHPRKASDHHYQNAVELIKKAEASSSFCLDEVDMVAFSRGPGIAQCLEVGATVARALSIKHNARLFGANHCLAHITIGERTRSIEQPTTLYVSGGNTQIIEKRKKRYRVVGETLDTALGNALDKLAREMGHPHPGGPEIEKLSKKTDEILEVSYPIKGMDLSYSGLVTELKGMIGDKKDELIANTFQEHAFAAAVEALERAMAQSGSDKALLTGGVAMNSRLREMMKKMCEQRGAEAYFPPDEYCMDNGAMIAVEGLRKGRAGEETKLKESQIKPDWRPDEV